MRHMMPSQVAKKLEEQLPNYISAGSNTAVGKTEGVVLMGVLKMVDAIPHNLWISDEDYADLLLAQGAITTTMDAWNQGRGGTGAMPTVHGKNIPRLLYEVLSRCPDEHAPPQHAELLFVKPPELRDSIRVDVGGAYRALQHEEWKAASILGGAAIEALLYWKLGGVAKAERDKAARAPKNKTLSEWSLSDMILVAQDLKIITEKQATAALLAKGYRNLIHPGVAARLSESCTRSTAYSAIAGMEAVIEALTP